MTPGATLLFVTSPSVLFLAQLPGSNDLWKIGAQFGFNALLVVFLLYAQREREKERITERGKDRESLNLLTKAVTEVQLAMAFLPDKFKESAIETRRRLDELDK